VRISQKVHPASGRLYARVLEEGVVRPGDRVEILEAAPAHSAVPGQPA
jgi:MOSC domain-containing protein YiiM